MREVVIKVGDFQDYSGFAKELALEYEKVDLPYPSGSNWPDSTLCLLVRLRLLSRGYTSLYVAEGTGCPDLLGL